MQSPNANYHKTVEHIPTRSAAALEGEEEHDDNHDAVSASKSVQKRMSDRSKSNVRKSNAWTLEKHDIAKPRIRVNPKPKQWTESSPSPPKSRMDESSPRHASPTPSSPQPVASVVHSKTRSSRKTRSVIVDAENVVEDIERWSGAKWDKDKGFINRFPVSPNSGSNPGFESSITRKEKQHGNKGIGARHSRAAVQNKAKDTWSPATRWV
ncbi:hypothetical protein Ae201684_013449 [Aphanomyces euteiches]|uniref:Uncharacterized protein n=1 Tax=Aphanomyces euteiches TaxID=100861 RepID=A0A6G0WNE9_9STRA|nr:hypothetical protein Ae201684_013449 [Aphanomyces euteiches]KAH9145466.1 hypothetical protein AeRB84_010640 [Aphanomyces euteiches]